jgi:ABC-2 type transport system permease protein
MLPATVAMCTLGFFCSMLVRSSAVSTGIALAVIIIGNIVVHSADRLKAVKYFITPHFDLPLAWSGELSKQFAFPISLVQSLIILAVWTVVMYAIGHILFKRRDVLG